MCHSYRAITIEYPFNCASRELTLVRKLANWLITIFAIRRLESSRLCCILIPSLSHRYLTLHLARLLKLISALESDDLAATSQHL
jgi:hypothetical protein